MLLLCGCRRNDDNIIYNWQTIYENDNLSLITINFLNKDIGYIDAQLINNNYKNVLLKTEDSGNTWSIDSNNYPGFYSGIHPINSDYLLGVGSHIYESKDNGATWKDVSPNFVYGSRTEDLNVLDSITWIAAQGVDIYRTNNAGQTWQTVFHTDSIIAFIQFSFPSKNLGFASTGTINFDKFTSLGFILKTNDGGLTWKFLNPEPWKSLGTNMPYIYSMQFVTEQIGYISTYDAELYNTIDGGNNWALIHKNNNTTGLEYFISESKGFYCNGTKIFVTNDGGINWQVDYLISGNSTNNDILAWTFVQSGQGFAITRDHKILKKIN
jgi:photosystem II stability/assembly factor-like uncharacterized protein